MSATYLCVGGPFDGQYRTVPDGCISFRVASLPPADLTAPSSRPLTKVTDDSIEYLLVWSDDHGRFVWWCDQ